MARSMIRRNPLDLTAKLRQVRVREHLVEVIRGNHPKSPLVVELDPTSYCDLACPECISVSVLNAGRFSRDRILELTNEMVELRVAGVILIGGGEPLLHTGIDELITALHNGGVRIGLTTNGTQLHQHLNVIAPLVSWTRVSVDAATAATYAKFRPSRSGRIAFDDVVRNMELLAKRKQGTLGYSFLAMARPHSDGTVAVTNFNEIFAAARLAKAIGCDYFEVKPEHDMGHYVKGHRESLIRLLTDERDRLAELEDNSFQVLQQQTLDVVEGAERGVQPKSYDSCPIAELRTLITPAGAYFCPYHRGSSVAHYGDPINESLSEMWHSER
ncbi:radical SAM protein [Amycolatopsis sp. NPDC049252]|uniref:radical SAM protein n=1 Tax=Amycolatopsis sp. NPDC049252 TaxID=3363933 RepID=UPI00372161D5